MLLEYVINNYGNIHPVWQDGTRSTLTSFHLFFIIVTYNCRGFPEGVWDLFVLLKFSWISLNRRKLMWKIFWIFFLLLFFSDLKKNVLFSCFSLQFPHFPSTFLNEGITLLFGSWAKALLPKGPPSWKQWFSRLNVGFE